MTKNKNKKSKPTKKKSPKSLEAKTKQIVFEPDVFDLELLEALQKKIGRTTNDILKLALLQLYTDMCVERPQFTFDPPFWQIPNPPPLYLQDDEPEKIGIEITCGSTPEIWGGPVDWVK